MKILKIGGPLAISALLIAFVGLMLQSHLSTYLFKSNHVCERFFI